MNGDVSQPWYVNTFIQFFCKLFDIFKFFLPPETSSISIEHQQKNKMATI